MKNAADRSLAAFFLFMELLKMKFFRYYLVLGLGVLFLADCKPQAKPDTELASKKTNSRLDSINQKIEAEPQNAALYNERSIYFYLQKDLTSASRDILKAITLDSSNSDFYLTLSDIFFAGGKSAQSKRSLERSLVINPNNKEALLKMAELYLYVKDNKKSIEYLDRVLKIDVNTPKAYFIKGMDFKELGDTTKAISSFQTTVEQDPEYYNAYIQLGLMYQFKRNPMALDYYKNALQLNPRSVEALYNMAMYYQETNQLNRAIELYTTILKIEPQNKNANYNLGYIHFEYLKIYSEAVKHFTNAITCDNSYVEAIYMRGLCYETMGDVQNAAADYNHALTISPGYDLPLNGLKRLSVEH